MTTKQIQKVKQKFASAGKLHKVEPPQPQKLKLLTKDKVGYNGDIEVPTSDESYRI
jgi:hypothetical protein